MDVNGTASDLDRFEPVTWTNLVRAVVGDDDAELVSHVVEPIFMGIGTGTRVYRVTGTASTTPPTPTDWSLVMTVFTTEHLDFQSVSEDETAWDYWKREWQVYRSSWLPELDGRPTPPRCLGSGESTGENGPMAWVALEDLGHLPHQWPLAEFEDVACAWGRFGGRYLAGATIPDEPWLSKHRLTGWTGQHGPSPAAHARTGRSSRPGRWLRTCRDFGRPAGPGRRPRSDSGTWPPSCCGTPSAR